ncbi:MAG TPA: U32 family peptidase [Candidatus Competibacteraceae bacterium]|nr:U32 family peptidase [Candidatus Competibacteraceae bacterium]
MTNTLQLALGPITYFWPREQVFAFYERAAAWPVEIVYLGETVCAKRRALRPDDWLELAGRLEAAGKQVVLSTLALIEAESELMVLRRISSNGRFPVEANDMAAVQFLKGRPFVGGPGLNVYNARSLHLLAQQGLTRWVPPVELSGASLAAILADKPAGVATEVFAYGRLPLAYSARCFTARAHNLPKDDCRFRCQDYPDGLELATDDGRTFLAFNGIQTQSAQTYNLLAELPALMHMGVEVLRLSPQSQHMEQVVAAFDRARREPDSVTDLAPLMPTGPCDGYWHGSVGLAAVAQG